MAVIAALGVDHPVPAVKERSEVVLPSLGHALQLPGGTGQRRGPFKGIFTVGLSNVPRLSDIHGSIAFQVHENRSGFIIVFAYFTPAVGNRYAAVKEANGLATKVTTLVVLILRSVLAGGGRV